MKRLITLIAAVILFNISVNAQVSYKLSANKSDVAVTGTSTLHDWESKAEKIEGESTIVIEDGKLTSIDNLNFTVAVESIKSGKNGMDKKTREAFDFKKHPNITFQLSEITEITDSEIHANGTLNMAGATKTISVVGTYSVNSSGELNVEGSKSITMSDYGMKPPTALMGTIKSGDEVEVVFNVVYQKNQSI